MRRLILAAALLASASIAPNIAHAAAPVDPDLEAMARTLGDPARQQALARAMAAMSDVLLDIPLAPIIGPLAEAAGEDPRRIDRDATLRKMAPGAGDVSRQIERHLPRAMGAMAGMSTAIAGMLPQLRDIAERMREALPDDRLAEVPRAVD